MTSDAILALTGRELDAAVGTALGHDVRPGEGDYLVHLLWDGRPWSEGLKRYSTDPAAADLVRQEIERRGWTWFSWHCLPNDTFRKQVEWTWSIGFGGEADAEVFSVVGPHDALCQAFLLAHYTQQEPAP